MRSTSEVFVAGARNCAHERSSVDAAIRHLLDNLDVPLSSLVKNRDRVLVKVNMGCSGARNPDSRLTTHPLIVEAIIRSLQDCGAIVSFGDDLARSEKHYAGIYQATGMSAVARRTGATLVDFVAAGAREVRSGLPYPRKYLITNAYFDSDVVINAASCRSHVGIGLSGAVKNMFGCVVGLRKQSIHNLFPADPAGFGRAIADIYRVVRADLSFLDLTSVGEAAGITLAVRPVGILLASRDAVALDTVAAEAIGYADLTIWPSYYGGKSGIGCNAMDRIRIQGLDWKSFPKPRLQYPFAAPLPKLSSWDRITSVVNNTALRPRPVIAAAACTGCGDCARRCPVGCIEPSGSVFRINPGQCVDCGCCLKVCETGAAGLAFVGFAKTIRTLANRLPDQIDPKAFNMLDPAAKQ